MGLNQHLVPTLYAFLCLRPSADVLTLPAQPSCIRSAQPPAGSVQLEVDTPLLASESIIRVAAPQRALMGPIAPSLSSLVGLFNEKQRVQVPRRRHTVSKEALQQSLVATAVVLCVLFLFFRLPETTATRTHEQNEVLHCQIDSL